MDAKQRVQEKKPEQGIEIAGTTAAYKQNEKKLRFKGNFSCEFCIHAATRLSCWNALCDACSKSHDKRYNLGDKRLQVRIVEERFPNKHRGAKSCPSSSCPEKSLTILYDEVDDEWLYCGHCKKFKQLLRCWNMYTNTMVDYLERPMMKQPMGAIQVRQTLL